MERPLDIIRRTYPEGNQMEISQILKDVGLIVSMIIGLGGLFYTWTQAKKTALKTELESGDIVVGSMGEAIKIAKEAALEVKEVRNEMRLMQKLHDEEIQNIKMAHSIELKNIMSKLDEVSYQLEVAICEKEGIKDWAERLVSQLNSLDRSLVPVSMKPLKLPKRN